MHPAPPYDLSAHPDVPLPPLVPLEELSLEIENIVRQSALDKESALHITRVFNALEALLREERHMRMRESNELRHKIERTHMEVELDRLARKRMLDSMGVSATLQGPPASADAQRHTSHGSRRRF